MPKCNKCNEFLPPDVCEISGPGTHICYFCKENKQSIVMNGVELSKDWIKNDYYDFLNKLKEKENARLIAEEIKKWKVGN